jgi:hypothetical protein
VSKVNKTQVLNSPNVLIDHKAGIKTSLAPKSGQAPGQTKTRL